MILSSVSAFKALTNTCPIAATWWVDGMGWPTMCWMMSTPITSCLRELNSSPDVRPPWANSFSSEFFVSAVSSASSCHEALALMRNAEPSNMRLSWSFTWPPRMMNSFAAYKRGIRAKEISVTSVWHSLLAASKRRSQGDDAGTLSLECATPLSVGGPPSQRSP